MFRTHYKSKLMRPCCSLLKTWGQIFQYNTRYSHVRTYWCENVMWSDNKWAAVSFRKWGEYPLFCSQVGQRRRSVSTGMCDINQGLCRSEGHVEVLSVLPLPFWSSATCLSLRRGVAEHFSDGLYHAHQWLGQLLWQRTTLPSPAAHTDSISLLGSCPELLVKCSPILPYFSSIFELGLCLTWYKYTD